MDTKAALAEFERQAERHPEGSERREYFETRAAHARAALKAEEGIDEPEPLVVHTPSEPTDEPKRSTRSAK